MSDTAIPLRFLFKHPAYFLALGLGSGLLKPAPGTWGTLAAIPLYLAYVSYAPVDGTGLHNTWLYAAVIVVSFCIGIYFCAKTSHDLGVHDHGAIVWDEFVGLWIALFLIPPTWLNIALAFVLFRVFDIIKPWPIRAVDKHVHGGFGIMFDDVLAGVYACVCLHLFLLL